MHSLYGGLNALAYGRRSQVMYLIRQKLGSNAMRGSLMPAGKEGELA